MGVDPSELADQGLPGNFRECASHLDAVGASANHAEGQPDFAPFRVGFFFGGLNANSTRRRISNASSRVFSPGACCVNVRATHPARLGC
jgi:hypothetical protein